MNEEVKEMLPAQEMQVRRVSGPTQQISQDTRADHSFLYPTRPSSIPTPAIILLVPFATTDNDADNDVSDVASLASAHASTAASTASTTASSPRMGMAGSMQPPVLANPVSPVVPNAARRALARGRVDEVSGEGSQSEGLDSPT